MRNNQRNEKRSGFLVSLITGVLVVGIIIVVGLQNILKILPQLVGSTNILFLLTLMSFYLTSINSAYTATSYIKERMDLFNKIRVVGYVGQIVILVGCLVCFTPDVWHVGLGTVATSVVTILGHITITHRYQSEAKLRNGRFYGTAVKELLGNGILEFH